MDQRKRRPNRKATETCPKCGYCDKCGRSNAAPYIPYVPYVPPLNPYPYRYPWQTPWITWGINTPSVSGSGTVTAWSGAASASVLPSDFRMDATTTSGVDSSVTNSYVARSDNPFVVGHSFTSN